LKIEDIEVELVQHKGLTTGPLGQIEIDLPQKVVMVNGVWAGYVGDAPGSHVSLIITQLSDAVLAEIKRQVDEIRGVESSKIAMAKTIEQSVVKADDSKTSPLSDSGL